MKKIAIALLIGSGLLTQQVHAYGVAPAVVYTNMTWNVSTNAAPLLPCNNMVLDGTGSPSTSTRFVAYGTLNCPGIGGLAATGTAYIGTNGSFNMTLTFAGGSQMVCGNLSFNTLTGTCAVYNSAGTQIGTAFIGYVP